MLLVHVHTHTCKTHTHLHTRAHAAVCVQERAKAAKAQRRARDRTQGEDRNFGEGRDASVATKIFKVIAQFRGHGGLPRPEGPRQSLRSGSRSDSFRGSGHGGCTEMHYSPRIWPERDPELRLIRLSLPLPPPGRLRRPACLRPTIA
jgi:hypothetical protein